MSKGKQELVRIERSSNVNIWKIRIASNGKYAEHSKPKYTLYVYLIIGHWENENGPSIDKNVR